MDRFIADSNAVFLRLPKDLKSNMDRFIESALWLMSEVYRYLKSNMDRFIEYTDLFDIASHLRFKIQYG